MVSSTSSRFLCVAREPVSEKYFMANHELTDWSPAICLAGRCKGHISIGITSPFQPLSPKESCGRTKRFTPDVSSHASPSGGQPTHWRANQYESHRIDTIGSGMGAVSLHLSLTVRSLVRIACRTTTSRVRFRTRVAAIAMPLDIPPPVPGRITSPHLYLCCVSQA